VVGAERVATRPSEKLFRQRIYDLARRLGWMVYWTWNSRHSPPGFPDIIAVRDGHVVVAELKVGRNRCTSEQLAWLDAWRQVPGVTVMGPVYEHDDAALVAALTEVE
jgi:hypothetical protein